jgi:hypothetical protein
MNFWISSSSKLPSTLVSSPTTTSPRFTSHSFLLTPHLSSYISRPRESRTSSLRLLQRSLPFQRFHTICIWTNSLYRYIVKPAGIRTTCTTYSI